MRLTQYLALGFAIMFLASGAEGRDQARSMVISTRGIVAASQTLAAQAGAEILARGGSAVDAGIAANAALGVVEPMMNGIGGDLFAIYREAKSGARSGLNSSGFAPLGLTPELLRRGGATAMPASGIHTVTVPGCVAGWAQLHAKFGRLPWRDLFEPAIYYAERGFPVTEWIAADWGGGEKKLSTDPYNKTTFLPGGRAPRVGEVYRNPDLAKALRLIAEGGPAAFYRGPIGEAILAKSKRLGGTLTAVDFAAYEPEWAAPISTTYRGWTVYELPPNSQGLAALSMLNLMERFDLAKLGFHSPAAWHIKIEAQKLAYQDLNRFVGDPKFAQVPVAGMIDKGYAALRAALIDPKRANCQQAPGEPALPAKGDTIYLAVVDADGNVLSLIQSIYQAFGSAIPVDGFGFHLHNRGALFTLEEGHPNVLAPRKRPFQTIIPALMENQHSVVGFGIMGGLNQAQAHAQFVSNIADHGMNIQAALEAPRFSKQNFGGCDVQIESRLPEPARRALTRLGHLIKVEPAFAPGATGGGQAVQVDLKSKVHFGASSPRKDGAAIPEPDPYFPRRP